MLTTCPAARSAAADALFASADDAADNETPDPALAATPSGTPRCKSDDSNSPKAPRTSRSSPDDRTAARKIPRSVALGADPRATPLRQLTSRPPAHAASADNAGAAPDAASCRSRSPDNSGSPSLDANASPPHDTCRCNTGSADEPERTSARTPSANSDALDRQAAALAERTRYDAMTTGPREITLPTVKSRSQAPTRLRGDLWSPSRITLTIPPHWPALLPPRDRRALARATARFWPRANALLTDRGPIEACHLARDPFA